jgi:HAD superfamily hydrolase (TIGR01450 family)
MSLSAVARQYENFLLDLDGSIWVGDEPTVDAPQALSELRDAGKRIIFLTNDVRSAPEDYVRKLWRLGMRASVDEVVSAGSALQFVLAEKYGGLSAYVVGSQALINHVADAGLRILNNTEFAAKAELVAVGCHDDFTYRELTIAVQAVIDGAVLIGTTRDRTFPMPDGPWPGSGALMSAIETATESVAAVIAGKPEPTMYATALDRLEDGKTLAVGDNLSVDIAGAIGSSLDSALLFSGTSTRQELDSSELSPTYTANTLADLLLESTDKPRKLFR